MEDAIQQFRITWPARITTWPGALPPPRVWPPDAGYHITEDDVIAADVGLGPFRIYIDEQAGIEGDALAQVVGRGEVPVPSSQLSRSPEEVSATGEIYLELSNVDLDDPDAILSFVRRYGLLEVAHKGFALFRSLEWFDAVARGLAQSWPYTSAAVYKSKRGKSFWSREVETVAEFRFGALCIRDCISAWQLVKSGENPISVEWESIPKRALEKERDQRLDYGTELDSRGEAFEFFLVQTLGEGLIPFHPAVIEAAREGRTARRARGLIPLYSVCCLELFNHIAENATYRVCASETCGRVFVRQTGRAEHGQFRSRGVKYCSTLCARAQAQRMHRARKRG